MNFKLKCHTKKVYSDQLTPISAYLNVRAKFARSILLESSENGDRGNSRSIICANPIAGFVLDESGLSIHYKEYLEKKNVTKIDSIQKELIRFCAAFEIENKYAGINGFFGFQSFEAAHHFESKKRPSQTKTTLSIIDYSLYQYVICFNHFNNEITFIENTSPSEKSTLDHFSANLLNKKGTTFTFQLQSVERSPTSDEDFIQAVEKAQEQCKKGNVFQLVLSRKFSRSFSGDEFNVYRALRHINPSPYMFYFDYGSYKIFGSSPEAQLRISDRVASVNPIAGTYRKTGNPEEDQLLAARLLEDKKECAEHAMLVDLARNDLNRHCRSVEVVEYKKIKLFSHVIHMVSNVSGTLDKSANSINVLADTFPAGTLSGAPKIKAIELIEEIEKSPRTYYGGSIGFIDFNGNLNQAIIIRSFMTQDNEINYQAGAGVVLKSDPESELQEVNNKLFALRTALEEAQNF